jgi:hypothetical protein
MSSPSYYLSVHSWSNIDILLEQILDVSVGDANLKQESVWFRQVVQPE